MTTRPEIVSIKTSAELRRWYWRKDELIPYARDLGLKTSSGKFEILDRIAHYLDTGEKRLPSDSVRKKKSKFDWHSEPLFRSTKITDSYKNTQNVRRFFRDEADPAFKFNIALMDWMKNNTGRTLADACEAYHAIKEQERTPGFKTKIKSHNQLNQYTRDFLDDNPNLGMADMRKIWALKIQLLSTDGRHVYSKSDLNLAAKQ